MNILFSINHPAHVHYFRNAIEVLKAKNYKIWVTARDKEMTVQLLEYYDIDYMLLSEKQTGFVDVIKEFFSHQYKLLKILKKYKIRLVVSIDGVFCAIGAWILGIPSIEFSDTEHSWIEHFATYPFISILYTPSCYLSYMGKKQVRYQGYHELAYLHPKYFKPDDSILNNMGIEKDEKYVLLRFVSWDATHDFGQRGLSLKAKRELIRELSNSATVYISSEECLDEEFQQYKINTHPCQIHHLLANASLLISEGATMASEGAILGVPTIYINSLKLGYIEEQRYRYGLLYSFRSEEQVLRKSIELIKNNNLKNRWINRRDKLLSEKIDVTDFIVNNIEIVK
jgi:hypothetical protein|tara:strand:- start:1485 stop:2507 length:1023 start_codon:yes stop_codon:yes gene_type:complete